MCVVDFGLGQTNTMTFASANKSLNGERLLWAIHDRRLTRDKLLTDWSFELGQSGSQRNLGLNIKVFTIIQGIMGTDDKLSP